MRRHLTYANVMSTLCLFILLGGSAYAATKVGSKQIADNSVQGKDIKNGSITGKDVKKASLTSGLFAKGQLPRGATGATGAAGAAGATGGQGPQGTPGTPATKLFASVGSAGQLNFGSGAVSSSGSNGAYQVTFDRDLTRCVAMVTPGYGSPNPGNQASSSSTFAGGTTIFGATAYVTIGSLGNGQAPSSFFVAIFC